MTARTDGQVNMHISRRLIMLRLALRHAFNNFLSSPLAEIPPAMDVTFGESSLRIKTRTRISYSGLTPCPFTSGITCSFRREHPELERLPDIDA